MKKIKAAVLAATVVAGLAVAVTPAQASECKRGGGIYLCEYGVTAQALPDGTTQEFIVGTDRAVWTRTSRTDGSWGGWWSLGGVVISKPRVYDWDIDPWAFTLIVTGTDNRPWYNYRNHDGNWTGWMPYPGNPDDPTV
ncbi:hypothetical protein [Streptomyces palmae]|uniref:PLL-like beta propeller domain-containing protein n=1 Tax=Streptomyces palmae TaxID=1701085 RepID=A0A4Z0H6H4_9ACTN|nr:hypothetical protein [Streptomyces palmae]TGB08469.1 hypothetical protein E4099_15360 [Streptomyces palmae]